MEARANERDRLNKLIDSQSAHISRLEEEIRLLRSASQTYTQQKSDMTGNFEEEKKQLAANWEEENKKLVASFEEEKKKLLANFEKEKKELKAQHEKSQKDLRNELERAHHLENMEQKQELNSLRKENRQVLARNEVGC